MDIHPQWGYAVWSVIPSSLCPNATGATGSHTGVVHPCTIYSLANGAIVVEIHDLYSPPELLQAIFPHSKHLVRSNLKALYGDLL